VSGKLFNDYITVCSIKIVFLRVEAAVSTEFDVTDHCIGFAFCLEAGLLFRKQEHLNSESTALEGYYAGAGPPSRDFVNKKNAC